MMTRSWPRSYNIWPRCTPIIIYIIIIICIILYYYNYIANDIHAKERLFQIAFDINIILMIKIWQLSSVKYIANEMTAYIL